MENKSIEVVNVKKNENISHLENKTKPSIIDGFKNLIFHSNTKKKNDEKKEVGNSNEKLNTADDSSDKNSGIFTKFLKNKNAKVAIIVLIFGVIALLILNSNNLFNLTSTKTGTSSTYTTSLQYCEMLETKLINVLSKISGVGNVKVMVTVKSAPELIIASSSDEKTNTTINGSNSQTNTTISKDPIIVTNGGGSNALILTEMTPEITGVVVVAEGAKDVKIKLSLLEAIQALLQVKSSNIQIYY